MTKISHFNKTVTAHFTPMDDFAQRLSYFMLKNNESNASLGEAVGLSSGTISNYRNGHDPRLSHVRRLAAHFEVSIIQLTGDPSEHAGDPVTDTHAKSAFWNMPDKVRMALLGVFDAVNETVDELKKSSNK
jgi:transcriptional regulator with XRE-family HTH domain